MMKLLTACMILISLALPTQASAGRTVRVELNDGSVIQGEVVSVSNGVYSLSSDSLGTVKIDESKIRNIRIGEPMEAKSDKPINAPPGIRHQAEVLQERMTGSQEIMGLITSLSDDPDFQAILKDENLMKAVNAGDVQALMSNPGFIKLLEKPTVRSIIQKSAQ